MVQSGDHCVEKKLCAVQTPGTHVVLVQLLWLLSVLILEWDITLLLDNSQHNLVVNTSSSTFVCIRYVMLSRYGGSATITGFFKHSLWLTMSTVSKVAVAVSAIMFTRARIKLRSSPTWAKTILNSSPQVFTKWASSTAIATRFLYMDEIETYFM